MKPQRNTRKIHQQRKTPAEKNTAEKKRLIKNTGGKHQRRKSTRENKRSGAKRQSETDQQTKPLAKKKQVLWFQRRYPFSALEPKQSRLCDTPHCKFPPVVGIRLPRKQNEKAKPKAGTCAPPSQEHVCRQTHASNQSPTIKVFRIRIKCRHPAWLQY